MKQLLLIDLTEEDCRKIQRTTYEVNSTQNVINLYLTDHMKDTGDEAIESPVFRRYQRELVDLNIRFDEEKDQLTQKYIPQDVIALNNYSWNVNFSTKQLEVTYDDKTEAQCGCGCKCN